MSKKLLPTLFKETSTGKIQLWSIRVEGDSYYSLSGQEGGKIREGKPTVAKPKNVGKANETTPEEQAQKEAKAKWQKKLDKDYFLTKQEALAFQFSPLLAKTWDKQKSKLLDNPAMISPKLDGVRCYIKKDGAYSRSHKKFVSTKYIEEALEPYFEKFPNAILDGELYNHLYKEDFNQIISLVRREKNFTDEHWKGIWAKLEFHIFEQPILHSKKDLKNTAWMRYTDLKTNFFIKDEKYQHLFKFVDQHTYPSLTQDLVDNKNAYYLEKGYEGVMVKGYDSPYKMGRSSYLLKVKDFKDAEATIIKFEEGLGNRSSMAGKVTLKDENGMEFEASMRGGEELYTHMWENPGEYKGKKATFRYQNKTPDGRYRMPVMIAVRDYE